MLCEIFSNPAIIGFFSGIVGVIIGAGANYFFQQKLLDQQLDFQKKQGEEEARLRQKIADESTRATNAIEQAIQRIYGAVLPRDKITMNPTPPRGKKG